MWPQECVITVLEHWVGVMHHKKVGLSWRRWLALIVYLVNLRITDPTNWSVWEIILLSMGNKYCEGSQMCYRYLRWMVTFFVTVPVFWNLLTTHEVISGSLLQYFVTAEMSGQHGQELYFKKPRSRHWTGNFGCCLVVVFWLMCFLGILFKG